MTPILTPVEQHCGISVKRDDLADECGTKGGKARTLGVICRHIVESGWRGLTIHAARNSVTPATLGAVCRAYGVPACVHTAAAKSPLSESFLDAVSCGVRVVEHRPGYMSVLAARARDQAVADKYLAVGLGLDYPPAILETAKQCANIPRSIGRVVVAVGSGHMLEGIIKGLENEGLLVPVLGVCVGKVPDTSSWMDTPLNVEFLDIGSDFHKPAPNSRLGDIELNPYYEAKCIQYLREEDLFWIVAK